jgi:hypothetical protein
MELRAGAAISSKFYNSSHPLLATWTNAGERDLVFNNVGGRRLGTERQELYLL